ncbi:MAG: RNA polymerase sigma factor [Parasphingorhabdus sp.]
MTDNEKSKLGEMLRKVRAALLRRGVSYDEVEDLVQEAFLKVEQYERKQSVRSREAMVMTAAVNLLIDKARRDLRAPFTDHHDVQALADLVPNPEQIIYEQSQHLLMQPVNQISTHHARYLIGPDPSSCQICVIAGRLLLIETPKHP